MALMFLKGYIINSKKLISISIFDIIAWIILVCVSSNIIKTYKKVSKIG